MSKSSVSILAAILASIGFVGFSAVAHPDPMIIWNASASVPVGLYLVISGAPRRHDLVLVQTPNSIDEIANSRGYLPIGVPLVKRIVAVEGDNVCISKSVVTINEQRVVRQLTADRKGRPLPLWNECRMLQKDEYFLLGKTVDSFDSRYFGPVKSDLMVGRLVPLWTE